MGWTLVALRRLRSDLAPTLGVLVLVLVTALLAALAPRVLASLADGAVRGAVDAAPVQARNVAVLENGIDAAGDGDGPAGSRSMRPAPTSSARSRRGSGRWSRTPTRSSTARASG